MLLAATLLIHAPPAPARAADAPRRILALLTDYGTRDFYVATLRGAILSVDPRARVIDLTHEVPPFDIREGAFLLAESSREFPPGTVFVAIVDPGVGTTRKPVAIRVRDGSLFVGPDNGLLVDAARMRGIVETREIASPAFMRHGARSSTFHGRDLFGPAGAHLARGDDFAAVGPVRKAFVELPHHAPRAQRGRASGEVLHVDRYGNLITNLTEKEARAAGLVRGGRVRATVGKTTFDVPYAGTYGDVARGERVLVTGSTGRLELAINEGDLGRAIGARAGEPVSIEAARTAPD